MGIASLHPSYMLSPSSRPSEARAGTHTPRRLSCFEMVAGFLSKVALGMAGYAYANLAYALYRSETTRCANNGIPRTTCARSASVLWQHVR
jgi:hypothetical protein